MGTNGVWLVEPGLPKLSRDQLADVERELLKGAAANGYPNVVWTLQRVAEVIERLTGVSITRLGRIGC